MKKFLKSLERDYNMQVKLFNFWIGIAEKANSKAKLAKNRCETISNDIQKVRNTMTEEISKTSKEGLY